MTNLADFRTRTDRLLADLRHAERVVEEESANFVRLCENLAAAIEAQQVVQGVAQQTQTAAHARIAAVVTRCLRTVFGEDAYEFRIDFERKRGKTEARLLFLRDGHTVDPVNAAGGGVVQVAAFALRIASLLLATPRRRRILVMDEPLAMLSKEYAGRMGGLIYKLAEELGFQVVMTSHNRRLASGKVIEIGD